MHVDRIEQVSWMTFFFLGLVRVVVVQVGVEVDSQLSRLVQGAVELVVGHLGDFSSARTSPVSRPFVILLATHGQSAWSFRLSVTYLWHLFRRTLVETS